MAASLIAVIASLSAIPTSAWALKFSELSNAQGQSVLLVHDCGVVPGEKGNCRPFETSFTGPNSRRYGDADSYDYAGDAAILESHLRTGRYAQVWLYSGGGNLDEGVKIGELLRQYRQFTYVPPQAYCVSACTVAFLGGIVRDIDDSASYEVHAYSSIMNLKAEIADMLRGPAGEKQFRMFLEQSIPKGRLWAVRLFSYVQRMIGGRIGNRSALSVAGEANEFLDAYWNSPARERDNERMQAGGAPAVQEILMRLEREAFEWHLAKIDTHADELGTRSRHAIRILQVMFSSRIAGTAKLDRNTLHEYGYTNVRR